MRRLLTRMLVVMLLSLYASCSGVCMALAHESGEDHEMTDGDKALDALRRGEVLPLEQVISKAGGHIAGEISGIELEKEHGIWVYEFKVISPRGQMVKVYIDGKTGSLIEKKGK